MLRYPTEWPGTNNEMVEPSVAKGRLVQPAPRTDIRFVSGTTCPSIFPALSALAKEGYLPDTLTVRLISPDGQVTEAYAPSCLKQACILSLQRMKHKLQQNYNQ